MTAPTPAAALAACLRLMRRATPPPTEAALWHDTIREASRILAEHDRDRVPMTFVPELRNTPCWYLAGIAAGLILWLLYGAL